MLKNEFQSMIEQYSNELMNISRQSGGEIPANVQPKMQDDEVPTSVQPITQKNEIPTSVQPTQLANEQPTLQAEEVSVNAQPTTNEISSNAQPTLQASEVSANAVQAPIEDEVPVNVQPTPVQTPNIMQAPAMPPQQSTSQPRDIPRNNAAVNNQPPVTNNFGKYRDDSANMTYEQFLSENPGRGLLKVQVFSGQQVTPIPNAEVVVSKEFLDGIKVFFSGLTDISGIVDDIQLPAPNRELSESPQPRGNGVDLQMPYSQYNVTIRESRHRPQEYTHVPVFDGVKSIQPVRLTPIQFENGDNSTIVFTESEPNNL